MDYVGQVARIARVRRKPATAWGLIAGLFALSVGVRLLFATYVDPTPFAPFIPAVLIAALACGWRRATVLLAAFAVTGWFLAQARPHALAMSPSFELRAPAFVALGGFIIALTEALAQALERLESVAQLNADLFRELQHRVANNFQIVAATLQKARRHVADPAALEAMDGAAARIDSLGRLHRRLYDPDSYAAGLEPILREVLDETFRGVAVKIRIDVKSENLSAGQMTTIVLLVNEAAINAAKHVFARRLGGMFTVLLQTAGRERLLTISDDGPGLPAASPEPTSRFGLTVMRGLAAQLGGALELVEGPGATIRVAFSAG